MPWTCFHLTSLLSASQEFTLLQRFVGHVPNLRQVCKNTFSRYPLNLVVECLQARDRFQPPRVVARRFVCFGLLLNGSQCGLWVCLVLRLSSLKHVLLLPVPRKCRFAPSAVAMPHSISRGVSRQLMSAAFAKFEGTLPPVNRRLASEAAGATKGCCLTAL